MSNTVNNVYQNMLKVYQNGLTQSATAEYVLTSVDIVNGFVAVPVVWDMPWLDLDIAITFSIKDLGTNGPSLDYVQGDMHDITTSGFTSIVDIFGAIINKCYRCRYTTICQLFSSTKHLVYGYNIYCFS